MTPEGKIKQQIDQFLKASGCWYFKPVSNGLGRHGIPDYVCMDNGRSFFIEAKKPGGQPTALQLGEKQNIETHGGNWFLVDGDESLREVAKWLDADSPHTRKEVPK